MENTRRSSDRRRRIQRKRALQRLTIVAVLALALGVAIGWKIGSSRVDKDKEVANSVETPDANLEQNEAVEPEDQNVSEKWITGKVLLLTEM